VVQQRRLRLRHGGLHLQRVDAQEGRRLLLLLRLRHTGASA